jgi:putative hydrolase of HD superfamily
MTLKLSDDDWAFITETSARFPEREIKQKFEEYEVRHPEQRLRSAAFNVNLVKRNGWYRVGIPYGQSVGNHIGTLREMVALIPEKHRDRVSKMLAVHDMAEVIISDFTPREMSEIAADGKITTAEKKRLERLAINLIYKAQPEMIALWEEFEEEKTVEALLAKDLDRLECIFEAEMMEARFPHLADNLQEFWNGMAEALHTNRGRDILEYLLDTSNEAGTVSKYQRIARTARHLNGPR